MTARELIAGLRERGYRVHRMQSPPQTRLACIYPDDPLFNWLQQMGVEMLEYRRSREHPQAYEAQLHKARVEVILSAPDLGPSELERQRAREIWEAAAA